MRIFSILTALVVTASLYMLVFERPALLTIAAAEKTVTKENTATVSGDATGLQSVAVVAVKSTAQRIDTAVLLRGQTEAARTVTVSAETSGRIVSPPLRKGTFVSEGQTLCQLDPGTREAQLAESEARLTEARARGPEAQARIAEAEARLTEAEINDNAASKLSKDGYASQSRVASTAAAMEAARAAVQAAKSGLESASSGVQAAEAALAGAMREIEKLTIAAPFSGLLETDSAELGTLMQPGALCATVIQLDPIKLIGFVPETAVSRVTVGAMAGARLASGEEVTGRVTFLSRSADQNTRTFRTEVEVANGDLAIRDGQTAEILIQSDGRTAHLLPQSALTLNDNGDLGVRLVSADDTALFAPVTVQRDTAQGIWLTGLDDVVSVIVVGQEYVIDGVPVTPTYREADKDSAGVEPGR